MLGVFSRVTFITLIFGAFYLIAFADDQVRPPAVAPQREPDFDDPFEKPSGTNDAKQKSGGVGGETAKDSNDEAQSKPTKPKKKPRKVFSAAQIDAFIGDLNSDSFSARRKATAGLLEAGPDAIEALANAVKTGDLELCLRAFKVYESVFSSSDVQGVNIAWESLEALSNSDQDMIAERCQTLLTRYGDIRTRVILAKLKSLNATVEKLNPRYSRTVVGEVIDDIVVYLDRNWTGGDEGLKYVKLLTSPGIRPVPKVYLINGAPISKAADLDLEIAIDGPLVFQRRGAASLGISSYSLGGFNSGCVIQKILPGKAADKAGLEERDIITQFGDEPVPNFEALIEMIKKRQPGDVVSVKFLRRGLPRELKVSLSPWRAASGGQTAQPGAIQRQPAVQRPAFPQFPPNPRSPPKR